jgi:hypothetical protein
MKLVLFTLLIATGLGYLSRGHLSNLSAVRLRWSLLAPLGLALQVLPLPGRVLPMTLLIVSFGLLFVFALANLPVPGMKLILLGMFLNCLVISVNAGMPVSRSALEASGQHDTLSSLIHRGGAKHHLAGPTDSLVVLGDVIPIGIVHQVASLGDVATYLGVMWLVVAGMRCRPGEHGSIAAPVAVAPEVADVGI